MGPAISAATARVLLCLEEMGAEYQLVPVDLFHPRAKVPSPSRRKRKRNQTFPRVNQQHACLDHRLTFTPAFANAFRGKILNSESRAISRYVQRKYKSSGPDLPREGSLEESAMVDFGWK
nr:PREDICTED: probable glutathione S-transferase GSTF1 [Musa acuminata subsp. malaccensis]